MTPRELLKWLKAAQQIHPSFGTTLEPSERMAVIAALERGQRIERTARWVVKTNWPRLRVGSAEHQLHEALKPARKGKR